MQLYFYGNVCCSVSGYITILKILDSSPHNTTANTPVVQVPQCISLIAHNAPVLHQICACVHILFQNGALWDICRGIREMGLLFYLKYQRSTHFVLQILEYTS